MQIRHADQGEETSAAIRGGDREFKTLLVGDENSPDNFRLVLARQSGKVAAPRHKHNFDQIRMCLSGDGQKYGPNRWIGPARSSTFRRAFLTVPRRVIVTGLVSRSSLAEPAVAAS